MSVAQQKPPIVGTPKLSILMWRRSDDGTFSWSALTQRDPGEMMEIPAVEWGGPATAVILAA